MISEWYLNGTAFFVEWFSVLKTKHEQSIIYLDHNRVSCISEPLKSKPKPQFQTSLNAHIYIQDASLVLGAVFPTIRGNWISELNISWREY